jgi:hypothetical protein
MSGTETDTTTQAGQEVPATGTEDRPIPHLTYDDPPGGMDADGYKAILYKAARELPGEELFLMMLLQSLGPDLIDTHGVDPEVAVAAIEEFGKKVFAEANAAPAAP